MRARLQKLIAASGLASRRGAEEMIARGDVTVNGRTARLGESADPDTDVILVAGVRLSSTVPSYTYVAWNKPRGVVTSLRSTHGEPTVRDFLRTEHHLFPVGRLDKETSGLLLLTDDGDWANLVTHPRYSIEKEYVAVVRGHPEQATVRALEQGVLLPGGVRTAPARVQHMGDDGRSSTLSITVVEGKKRQIRLMAAAVGHPVVALERVRIGPIPLGDLRPGTWRPLTTAEVEGIRESARRAPANSR